MTKHIHSLGDLARRISAWTTKGLLTLILVVMALGFGREVLHWWHEDAAKPTPPAVAGEEATRVQSLEFGEQSWLIRREAFSGAPGDLPRALLTACRAAIGEARPRGETPDAAEKQLLQRLAGQQPAAEERGQWRLYQWNEGRPVMIGTRTSLDKTAYRVVIWGLAIPAGNNAWTLYLFQASGAVTGLERPENEVPLPPGGHRLVAIRAGGDAILAFSLDDCDAARGYYDHWFAQHQWTVALGWQAAASGWQARYERRSTSPGVTADIRLATDAQGRWTGLVMQSELESVKR